MTARCDSGLKPAQTLVGAVPFRWQARPGEHRLFLESDGEIDFSLCYGTVPSLGSGTRACSGDSVLLVSTSRRTPAGAVLDPWSPTRSEGGSLLRGRRLTPWVAARSAGAGWLWRRQLALWVPNRSGGRSTLRGRRPAPRAEVQSVGADLLCGRQLASSVRSVSFFNAPVSATSAVACAESDAVKKTRLGRLQNRTCRLQGLR